MAGLRLLEEYLNREFGTLDEGDLERQTKKRAGDIAAGVPQIRANEVLNQETPEQGIPDWSARPGTKPSNDNFLGEDTLRSLGAGVADLGSSLVGVPEYIARHNKFLRPYVAPALEQARHGIEEVGRGIMQGVSPDFLEASGREFLTLDPDKTVWQGGPLEVGEAIYSKFVRSIPSTLATMIPPAFWFRAGSTAGALTYLGASEGAMSLGQVQNNIADEITNTPTETLLQQSQRFAELMDQYQGDETRARQDLTAEAQGAAPLAAGATVAAISMATGRLLKPIFVEGGMSLPRRAGTGAAEEFLQESSQSSAEQLAQNLAAQIYDQNRPLMQGVGEQAVQGGVIGALSGGAFGGAFGQRPETPLPAPVEGEGGQFGIPGIGPAQPPGEPPAPPPVDPGLRTEDPAEVARRNEQLDLRGGMDLDPRSGRDLSSSREFTMVPPSADSPTGVPDQGVLPMTLRERGRPTLQENPRGARTGDVVPDALDQPTAEPQADLQAQINDMKGASGRSAVYLSPEQTRTERLTLPKGVVVIPNFDGKGGRIIAKNQEAADYARQRRAEGGSMQAIIGELTLAGTGKPNVKSGYAVQLIGEDGAVARESLVATKTEANALEKQWSTDGETRVLSGEEALARRSDLLEREQVDLSQDQTAVNRRNEQLDLGPGTPTVLPPYKSTRDKVAERVRKETPFEERENALRLTRSAKDEKQAAARLAENAKEASRQEQRKRIGGYIAPSELVFDNAEQQAEYEAAFNEALDAELTIEMSGQKSARERAEKKRSAAFKRLATARKIGKPKIKTQRSERLARAAAAVDKSTARTRLKDLSTSEQPVDTIDDFGELDPTLDPDDVRKAEGQDLNVLFEQAINTYVARQSTINFPENREEGKPVTPDEVASNANLLEKEYRAQYNTPGKKRKLILRELSSQKSRAAEVRDVKATKVRTTAKRAKTTAPLTVEKIKAEESVADRVRRKEKVKQADSRLRTALRSAKKFLQRFETSGEYGTYIENEKNLDGSLSQAGRDFALARETFSDLVQLGDSIIASATESHGHVELADSISSALEKVGQKSMSPEKFTKTFSDIQKAMEQDMLRTVPVKFRESVTDRDRKINKLNAERHRSRERQRMLGEKWSRDKAYTEVVAPIFRKFSEATQVGKYYSPTEFEIENLRYVLRSYRTRTGMFALEDFYKPIKEQLEYYGFEFDNKGDLIVQKFSPSENLIGSKFDEKFGVSKKAADELTFDPNASAAPEVQDSQKIRAERDVADQRRAVHDIRTANSLIRKFKEMTSTAKVTINGIKRQEQRFVRGLRKLGIWTDVSPTMGRISIGGYKSKTYRLVGPRLDNRTMLKADAKNLIQRQAEIPMPRELTSLANSMGGVERTAEEFVEQNTSEFFFEITKPEKYDADYLDAASRIGDILEARGSVSALDTLTEILKEAPVESFYYQLADKLSTLNLSDVEVAYGDPTDFEKGQLGKFRPSENLVLLNREALGEVRLKGDRVFGARVLHTVTHEILHAATHTAIRNDTILRRYFEALQQRTREHVIQNGIPRTQYGLKRGAPIDEFVVEAFSNYEFQNLLKQVKAEETTVWKKIIDFLRNMLGFTKAADTVFDAVMLSEDILFEESGVAAPRDVGDFYMMDGVLNSVGSAVRNRASFSNEIFQRVKETLKGSFNRFNQAAYNIMTMEQFREAYDKFFNGKLGTYVEAFNRRNASAAQYMQVPQDLSNEWTKLEESNPEAALSMSQLMTDATLNKETVDEPGEFKTRFDALPPEAQKLYTKVRDYYKDAVAKERAFLLQSALRGITGINFTEAQLAEVKTKQDLRGMLEKHVNEFEIADVIDTLAQMSNVSTLNQGDYFPLMRYGEHVVVAEKPRPTEVFEDRKEARARRAELMSEDPTLDVQYKQTEEGQWEVRTFEREFVMAETASEIAKEHERLVQEYGEANVKDPDLRKSRMVESAINSNAQLSSILKTLEGNTAAQAAIKNFYLRSLSETSMRKHEIRRKNRRGVRRDLQHRNLATYSKQASYYTAQLEHGWKMADAIKSMDEFVSGYRQGASNVTKVQLRSVLQHLQKRDAMGTDLPDVNRLVRAGVEGTHFFMLTSPSYWAINATQPWMITLPTMASKFGWGQSMAAMRDMQRLIAPKLLGQVKKSKGGLAAYKNRVLTEEAFNVLDQIEDHIKENAPDRYESYKELLNDLRDRHIIDINVFTEMREVAAGKTKSGWANMVDASRIMAHLTEVNNRVLTALSAYQLALNDGMSVEDAKTYAGDMVSQTQFNYSSQNKPPLFQAGGPIGGVAPLMFQFMQWPQHMYAHLIRNFAKLAAEDVITRQEARRAVLGLLGTHAAVGGLAGMMLQPIKWAFGFAMMALGDDDEPYTLANALSGQTFDRTVAEVTDDLFGTGVSTVVTKGLPAGLGVDLSARMSMGTFYYVDLRGDNAQSVLGSLVSSFGGATLNQGIKMGRGLGQVFDGEFLRGLETASPKMARDMLRAVRYSQEGLVNNAGDTVIDASEMSPYEVLVQFFGFQPTDVSNFYSAQNAAKDAEQFTIGRRTELMRRFRDAETAAEKREVQREIRDFNQSNPQERITTSALAQNIRAQRTREARFRRYGVNIDERKARFYEDYTSPYRDE